MVVSDLMFIIQNITNMFLQRDDSQLRKMRQKAYRQQLISMINQNPNPKRQRTLTQKQPTPNAISPQPYFMQQAVRNQQEKLSKRDQYIQELRVQYEKDIALKKAKKEEEKRRDLELDEKIRRENEELNRKYRLEKEMEVVGKKKNNNAGGGGGGGGNSNGEGRKQPGGGVSLPSIEQTQIQKTFSYPIQQSPFQPPPPPPQQQSPKYLPALDTPKPPKFLQPRPATYQNLYRQDFRKAKLDLQDQTHRMAQLRMQIQSSSRDNMQAKKYAQSIGLAELQNLNRMLQEKHSNYAYSSKKGEYDSLDVEVANRGNGNRDRGESQREEERLRGFYEFNL